MLRFALLEGSLLAVPGARVGDRYAYGNLGSAVLAVRTMGDECRAAAAEADIRRRGRGARLMQAGRGAGSANRGYSSGRVAARCGFACVPGASVGHKDSNYVPRREPCAKFLNAGVESPVGGW